MPRSDSTRSGTQKSPAISTGLHIEDFIAFRVSMLAHLIGSIVGLTYGRGFGVSLRQWRVLALVGQYGSITAQEVARRTPLDKSQVSRAADELMAHGFLSGKEVPGDRRRTQLVLTASGRRLHAKLLALGRERNARFAGVLTDAESAVFERALAKLSSEARQIVKELQTTGRKRGKRGTSSIGEPIA